MEIAQQVQAFGETEKRIWDAEFDELISVYRGDQAGERIRSIFARNRPFLLHAAQVAKAQFKGESFQGVDAQGGFGWQLLRPEHVRHLTTDADSVNIDWKRTVTAVGFNYFIGTAAAFNQINRRALVVILGVWNHNPSPKSIGTLLQISGITYPPYDYYAAMRAEGALRVWGFPKPKTLPGLEQLTLRMRDVDTGLDEPQLLGITYAESGYLQTQVPDLEAP